MTGGMPRSWLAVSTEDLGKRYGQSWALRDCSVQVPRGRISALVGPNGAGKSTLLHLLTGLRPPGTGQAYIFGQPPRQSPPFLAMVGFVAQEMPLSPRLTINDHRDIMARDNTTWDAELIASRGSRRGFPLGRGCGSVSGGPKAQVALALALAYGPGCCCWMSRYRRWTRWPAGSSSPRSAKPPRTRR